IVNRSKLPIKLSVSRRNRWELPKVGRKRELFPTQMCSVFAASLPLLKRHCRRCGKNSVRLITCLPPSQVVHLRNGPRCKLIWLTLLFPAIFRCPCPRNLYVSVPIFLLLKPNCTVQAPMS